jgi:mannitol-1-phosphate/altronate dehydrogenase
VKLHKSTLPDIPIPEPSYAREDVGIGIGIVHFGDGGFHRAHQGVVELLAAPRTRIISLTITEGGYEVDKVDIDSVNVFGLIPKWLLPVGEPIDVQDQLAEKLVPLARAQRDNPTSFIENRCVFGDLVDDKRFVDVYVAALESLHRDGARATLEALVGNP